MTAQTEQKQSEFREVGSGDWDRLNKAVDEIVQEYGRLTNRHGPLVSVRQGLGVLVNEINQLSVCVMRGGGCDLVRGWVVRIGAAALWLIVSLCGEVEAPVNGQPSEEKGNTNG